MPLSHSDLADNRTNRIKIHWVNVSETYVIQCFRILLEGQKLRT